MPEAIATPSRSGSTPPSARPQSAHASMAATMANWADRSSRRALTRSRTSVGSTAALPAICAGSPAAQSWVRRRTPDLPASRASHVLATSPPTGLVTPSPVTTTLLRLIVRFLPWRGGSGGGLSLLDVRHGVADGLEVLDGVVGDPHGELLLGGDDDLDHRQRVHVEVVGERLVELDVLGGDAGDLVDDVGKVGADLFGGGHLAGSSRCVPGSAAWWDWEERSVRG